MLTWKKILCPVDFSDTSRDGVMVAIDLAMKLDAEVLLLHVYDVHDQPAQAARSITEMDEILLRWKLDVEQRGVRKVQMSTAAGGFAAQEILRAAAENQADVVVMGTHGRRGLERVVLGSIAEQVLRRAPIPVITVRRPAPTVEDQPAA
jgi:universal stress protein A